MDVLSAITDNATQHVTWALTLLAGTVLLVVGTSHISPPTPKGRWFYIFFAPAWVLLLASMYFGDRVHRHAISVLMTDKSYERKIYSEINSDFQWQLNLMIGAVVFLGLWLILYGVWWVIYRKE